MNIDHLLRQRNLFVCIGPGGVGKTTVAASVAVRAAAMGRRVLVLTIDPARRLADALGLSLGEDAAHRVDLTALVQAGIEVNGTLEAAMFDQAQSMDHLMTRLAPDEATGQRVLRNRVYRAMAGSLARSHAYLAMERLHEAMTSDRYDLIVLDTPPTRSALDILDAPSRLASFLDEGVIRWFLRPKSDSWRAKIMAVGEAAATKLLATVAGESFVHEISEFFESFAALREGFHQRAQVVNQIMRAPTSAFALVSSADSTHMADARALAESLNERGLSLATGIYNRAYEPMGGPSSLRDDSEGSKIMTRAPAQAEREREALLTKLLAASAGKADQEREVRALGKALELGRTDAIEANRRAVYELAQLHRSVAGKSPAYLLARREHDLRDLVALYELSTELEAAFSWPEL
jgi:anion-transporting  ArsA/GET3 family ATPase